MSLIDFVKLVNPINVTETKAIRDAFGKALKTHDITLLSKDDDGRLIAEGGSLQGYDIFGGVLPVLDYYNDP